MTNVEIDLQLNDEQKAMRDMVRKFGAEVIRPAGVELDKLNDPADVIAKDSQLWDVFRQYRELGLHKTGFAQALGGIGLRGRWYSHKPGRYGHAVYFCPNVACAQTSSAGSGLHE